MTTTDRTATAPAPATDVGPAPRRGMALIVAGTPWDGIPMSERHVARHLADRLPVLWVDPPISMLTGLHDRKALARWMRPRLRRLDNGLVALSPTTVPGMTRPVLRDIARWQTRRAIRRAVRRSRTTVRATIVASPEGQLRAVPTDRAVLYATDDWPAGAGLMGLDGRHLVEALDRQLAEADVVVVVSDEMRRDWSNRHDLIEVVPNGCDTGHFSRTDDTAPPSDVTLSAPVAGFVGHLSERIDLALLEAVARRGIGLLLVGPRQPTFQMARMRALLDRPNVQWVGPKQFAELPAYLRCVEVGLTPYTDSAFNRASYPLKTLEYLAAGRRVVASDLPTTRSLDASLVAIAEDPEGFADAVEAALATPRTVEETEARRRYARRHDWSRRADDIARLAGLLDLDHTSSGCVDRWADALPSGDPGPGPR